MTIKTHDERTRVVKELTWPCSIPLSFFHFRKSLLKELCRNNLNTVEDLLSLPFSRVNSLTDGYSGKDIVLSFYRQLNNRFAERDHASKLKVLRNRNCRYNKEEKAAFVIFEILRPYLKKHRVHDALQSLPKTIVQNELKLRVLLAA
ncbi:hypothetical protein IT401_01245 [Candidatus Nomurabacteria bacterium]|nr:hypothetical protein [Candidatus Nomurabacteria bacterium]